jgi:hypothetical protein
MDILDLIGNLDKQIIRASSEANTAMIDAQAAIDVGVEKAEALTKLRSQRATLKEIATANGVVIDAQPEPLEDISPTNHDDDALDWHAMSRLDAVEHVLRSSDNPLHISQIGQHLAQHGRKGDTDALISASLSNLQKRRHTVVSVGRGNWEFVRAGTITGPVAAYITALRDVIVESSQDLYFGGTSLENSTDTQLR